MYIPTDTDCSELIPGMCGGKMEPTMLDNCDSMHFEGVENVDINQGVGIDLADGVKAYDSTGLEIPFEYEPTEIDKCSVGEHEVIYKAIGADERLLPSICGENFLSMACSGIGTLIAKRLVTIEQADPPTINGIGAATLSVDEPFDPMNGVTGVDDNGNPVDVTYNGKYTNSAEGDIASFETDLTDPLRSLKVNLEPIQDLHGYDSPWVGGACSNKWDEEWENGSINNNGQNVAYASNMRSKNYIPILPNTEYGFTPNSSLVFFWYDADKNFISYVSAGNTPKTSPSNARYLRFRTTDGYGGTYNHDIAINYPSSVKTYSPWENICPIYGHDSVGAVVSPTQDAEDGTTYTADLPQTVYGGWVDLVTGEGVIDRVMVTLDGSAGSLSFSEVTQQSTADGTKYVAFINAYNVAEDDAKAMSSQYEWIDKPLNYLHVGEFNTRGSYMRFVIHDQTLDTLAKWNNYLASNPMQLVYELVNPIPFNIDPQVISTLYGRNNVWSEQGDVYVEFWKSIPQGEFSYPLDGVYSIKYHAEDECGNVNDSTRAIIVIDVERMRTVLYEDGTFIINEMSEDTLDNVTNHGSALAVFAPVTDSNPHPWQNDHSLQGYVKAVEVGSRVKPKTTASWFYGFTKCTSFDLAKLDTSETTNMTSMFQQCPVVEVLDLSSFDTGNVTSIRNMFEACYALTTIYASNMFDVTDINEDWVFVSNDHLVGGSGTAYVTGNHSSRYARIDNPPTEPGYFTAKE